MQTPWSHFIVLFVVALVDRNQTVILWFAGDGRRKRDAQVKAECLVSIIVNRVFVGIQTTADVASTALPSAKINGDDGREDGQNGNQVESQQHG